MNLGAQTIYWIFNIWRAQQRPSLSNGSRYAIDVKQEKKILRQIELFVLAKSINRDRIALTQTMMEFA